MEELVMRYDVMHRAYAMGVITEDEWKKFCEDTLVQLMELNKYVLERLKNISETP